MLGEGRVLLHGPGPLLFPFSMASNNYLSTIIELNEEVVNDTSDKYSSYTFGIAKLMQESLENATSDEIVSTLDYGIAMVVEIKDILNPALTSDVDYFTRLSDTLKKWKTSVDFAKTLSIKG